MPQLAMLLLALSLAASPAAAIEPSPAAGLAAAFHNTILSTYPDGRQAKLWLNADGSYTGEGRRHLPSSGRWKIKGEKLCLRQRRPIAAPFSFCTPLHTGGVGTTWNAKAVTGDPITVKLVRGRPAL